MDSEPTATSCPNSSKSPESLQPVGQDGEFLISEKNRVGRQIIEKMTESEQVWREISEKQTVIHKLYADQIKVSDKFTTYNEKWLDRDYSISENIESFYKFSEVDEQVQLLSQRFEEMEKNLVRSGGIVRDLIRETKNYIGDLRKSLEFVIGATCVEDVVNVQIPDFDCRIQNYPDPDLETLVKKWEETNLEEKITWCLTQLEDSVSLSVYSEHSL